jgi:hypothetical protein
MPEHNPDVPRIKGDNPPLWKKEQANQLQGKIRDANSLDTIYLCGGLAIISAAVLFHWFAPWSPGPMFIIFLTAAAAVGIYSFINDTRLTLTKEIELLSKTFPLDAQHFEFTAPLSDRSTIRITVRFELPSELTATTSYNSQTIQSALVENLNRITESKLVIYTQTFEKPPSRLELQDFLNHELVQFQDENNISIMRVIVPIAIHVHPDKPKGVHV